MNERIRELAEQAGAEQVATDPNGEFVKYITPEMQKFAELIVRECMKLNHEHFNDEDPYSIDSLYRYHFGVKE